MDGGPSLSAGRRTRNFSPPKPRHTEREANSGRKSSYGKPTFPYRTTGAQLAWDLNSDRPFNPQALLALLRSVATVLDEGPVSGPGWTGTRYRFSLSHPDGTGGVVDGITCTVDVDSHGHIRSLVQTTVLVASGKPGTPGETIYRLAFTFSDFGARFSVIPPPASQVDTNIGVFMQF